MLLLPLISRLDSTGTYLPAIDRDYTIHSNCPRSGVEYGTGNPYYRVARKEFPTVSDKDGRATHCVAYSTLFSSLSLFLLVSLHTWPLFLTDLPLPQGSLHLPLHSASSLSFSQC